MVLFAALGSSGTAWLTLLGVVLVALITAITADRRQQRQLEAEENRLKRQLANEEERLKRQLAKEEERLKRQLANDEERLRRQLAHDRSGSELQELRRVLDDALSAALPIANLELEDASEDDWDRAIARMQDQLVRLTTRLGRTHHVFKVYSVLVVASIQFRDGIRQYGFMQTSGNHKDVNRNLHFFMDAAGELVGLNAEVNHVRPAFPPPHPSSPWLDRDDPKDGSENDDE